MVRPMVIQMVIHNSQYVPHGRRIQRFIQETNIALISVGILRTDLAMTHVCACPGPRFSAVYVVAI